MPSRDTAVSLRTFDGLHLAGTLVTPEATYERAAVLVHGGGVTREEGGFFTRLAAGLAEAGVASLRFDLRGHGESEGRQEETTLTAHLNDIAVALARVREDTGAQVIHLLGTSFGGGLTAYYAAKRPEELARLVLLNPQLDYKNRYVDQKPYWHGDFLDDEAAARLTKDGFIHHSPTVRHGRAMLAEVFWIRPIQVVAEIAAPTLIVHGTKDTFISVDASRAAAPRFQAEHQLVEIEGAQHGFAVHEDPTYVDPQSQEWQAFVIRTVADWLTAG
ncbi:lysophospholipase [Frankia casuarinae]|uniref:Alpha/beta hydrolase fold n=2 Tax=Frankia casuarinae (strain DSM 45818 / CECT 9043 / HFP020203 / CcI3) TaxID=106370 RepID=Q2J9Z1_FRACC|nr:MULTISPECIES: alpha/beta fold hydrolase [Frankia]ABD11901.1 alpha/beta hydrolase fold [Frankia casuarinae]ESZ99807.1 lysophospholipase [Frankia sp. CcI6]EYT89606.1 lysophospholipase [Frankia casuarinae]KDA40470.1 lysophospholipase [Frankia sp. BMG5.23]KFB02522.1 lysophospholipase [Frankia sp. Allo2]